MNERLLHCDNCKFFHYAPRPSYQTRDQCRVNPPRITEHGGDFGVSGTFPSVLRDQWRGAHRPRWHKMAWEKDAESLREAAAELNNSD
jgi:hypothetical protein